MHVISHSADFAVDQENGLVLSRNINGEIQGPAAHARACTSHVSWPLYASSNPSVWVESSQHASTHFLHNEVKYKLVWMAEDIKNNQHSLKMYHLAKYLNHVWYTQRKNLTAVSALWSNAKSYAYGKSMFDIEILWKIWCLISLTQCFKYFKSK